MKKLKFKIGQRVRVEINDNHTFKGKVEGVIYLVSCDGVENKLLQVDPQQLEKIDNKNEKI